MQSTLTHNISEGSRPAWAARFFAGIGLQMHGSPPSLWTYNVNWLRKVAQNDNVAPGEQNGWQRRENSARPTGAASR